MSRPRFKFRQKAGGTAPVFPPLVTTTTAQAVSEGNEKRIPLTANQGGVSWTITGGADAARYSIDGTDLVLPAKDFEAPDDSGANNTYVVTVRATNENGFGEATITTTVEDVAEGGFANPVRAAFREYATALVDTAIAGAPADAWITLSVTGNIKAELWLLAENNSGRLALSDGQSMAFRKNELADYPTVNAVGLAEGSTGTWTFTWSGGSGSIPWIVESYPLALAYTAGSRTPAGWGGPSIAEDCPGSPSDWTIQTQSTPGAFEKNANHRIVPTGVSYGGTKTIGTPAHGTQYTVTVRHGPGTYADRVYTITMDSNVIDVAPNPGVDVNGSSASNQSISAFYNRFHGDRVIHNRGTYNNGASTRQVMANGYFIRATNPATSQSKLVLSDTRGPYGGGSRDYTGRNHDAGWVTFENRFPQGADMGPVEWDIRSVKVDGVNTVAYIGTRFTGFNGSMPRFNNLSGGTPNLEWVMVDHCDFSGYTPAVTSRDHHQCFFINHNWCHDTGTGIYLLARHSQVVGNLTERIQNDPFNIYCYDTVMDTWDKRWSRMDWNRGVRKDYIHPYPRVENNRPHPDGNQVPELNATTCPLLFATAADYKVPFMLHRGNLYLRTNGVKQPDSSGTLTAYDEPDQQGFNGGTMKNANRLHDVRDLGNVYQCMYQMGIAPSCCDKTTSFVRHNTLTWAMYQQNWNPADLGYTGYVQPQQYIATGASWAGDGAPLLDHNAIQAFAGYNTVPATPVPNTPTQTGIASNMTAADFVDNDDPLAWENVEKWCGGPVVKANLAPSPTSRLRPGQANYPASGTRVVGALDNASIIDHRLRTVSATYMVQ